jgi:hypothetical protein
VNELLAFQEATPAGDLHAYVTVHRLDPRAGETTAHISVLRRDATGNGYEDPGIIEVQGDYRDDREAFYLALDDRIIDLIRNERESLLLDRTQRVVLRGESSGRLFNVFYKPGRSSVLEEIGHSLFGVFDLFPPKAITDHRNRCAWIREVEGRTFFDLIKGLEVAPFDACSSVNHGFVQLGRASALMFLLGNEDFHSQNLLWTPDDRPVSLDLETLGQAVFFGRQHRKNNRHERNDDEQYLYNGLNAMREGLFTNSDEIPVDFPEEAMIGFGLGVQKMFEEFERDEGLRQAVMNVLVAGAETFPLFTRVPLRRSMIYLLLNGMDFPVPHYSFSLPAGDLVAYLEPHFERVCRHASRFRGDSLAGYKNLMIWC